MAITYPTVLINEYLSQNIYSKLEDSYYGPPMFFPVMPTDIEGITNDQPQRANDVFAVYERMPQNRYKPFPHVKFEQTIYQLYKVNDNIEPLLETAQVIYDLLDREDESAQELNAWIAEQTNPDGTVTFGRGKLERTFKPVFFHSMRAYQLQESLTIVNPKTTRTLAGTKMIVEYKYHTENYQ